MEKTENRTGMERQSKRGALHRIDRGTFENLRADLRARPGAKAIATAYSQKGPCTTAKAIEYAMALPEKPRLGTLKKYDAMLKRLGAIVRTDASMGDREAKRSQSKVRYKQSWHDKEARKTGWENKLGWAINNLDPDKGNAEVLTQYLARNYPGGRLTPLAISLIRERMRLRVVNQEGDLGGSPEEKAVRRKRAFEKFRLKQEEDRRKRVSEYLSLPLNDEAR